MASHSELQMCDPAIAAIALRIFCAWSLGGLLGGHFNEQKQRARFLWLSLRHPCGKEVRWTGLVYGPRWDYTRAEVEEGTRARVMLLAAPKGTVHRSPGRVGRQNGRKTWQSTPTSRIENRPGGGPHAIFPHCSRNSVPDGTATYATENIMGIRMGHWRSFHATFLFAMTRLSGQ